MFPLVIFKVNWFIKGFRTAFAFKFYLYSPWTFLCDLRELFSVMHQNGFSLVWTLSCFFKFEMLLHAFEQILHLYGFSPVWTLSCFFKPDVSLHTFAQYLHLYGLSPVWILSCLFKSTLLLNAFEQVIYLYGLSSLWMIFIKKLKCKIFEHPTFFHFLTLGLLNIKLNWFVDNLIFFVKSMKIKSKLFVAE